MSLLTIDLVRTHMAERRHEAGLERRERGGFAPAASAPPDAEGPGARA